MDGVRKKAKYLQDSSTEPALHPPAQQDTGPYNGISPLEASALFPGLPENFSFNSEALNLEYSILSTMLSNPSATELPPAAIKNPPDMYMFDPSWMLHLKAGAKLFEENRGTGAQKKGRNAAPEQIYGRVTKPFNYTEGFHYLIKYIQEKMNREDMMQICRAVTMIRPSFISLIMNLTETDLIFMEKMFQRTLLELEKLIGFSGTPTVVWRRTGEIALVGKEFLLLTQHTKEELLGKKTYIYELMDNRSAVEYWNQFATHAFAGNVETSVMTTCILIHKTGRPVPCAFCFTIKRDIFDIPLTILFVHFNLVLFANLPRTIYQYFHTPPGQCSRPSILPSNSPSPLASPVLETIPSANNNVLTPFTLLDNDLVMPRASSSFNSYEESSGPPPIPSLKLRENLQNLCLLATAIVVVHMLARTNIVNTANKL
ncbi:uncharacterized protein VTP21DRAFT_7924 [Calcarisporiella thermophila]|uniref:uncharacterized protein n=1 Tax=Calcarisporiella thermophila TaxID=911321 RepID=UPI0037439E68